MLSVEGHYNMEGFKHAATQVVIRDVMGNILFVALSEGDRVTRLAHFRDPDFHTILRDIGLTANIHRITELKDSDLQKAFQL